MPRVSKDDDIHNSSRTIEIEITADDIKKGTPLDPTCCAAAICILRSIKNATKAEVHRNVIFVTIGAKKFRFLTATDMRMETIIYDRGGMFMPGKYRLNAVPASRIYVSPSKKRSPSKGMTPRQS